MQGNSKEADLAYIAGIIDGEGSILITRDVYSNKNPVMRVIVRVGMIEEVALKFMQKTLKVGKFYKEKPYHHKRAMNRLVVTSYEEVKSSLESLLPFLKVKKEQALLALKFIDECRGKRGHWMAPEDIEKRLSFWIKMRELNGITAPATTERTGKRGRRKSVRLEATV